MRPISSPGPFIKASFSLVFVVFNFCLFITAAVAWSHHRHNCFAAWADIYDRDRPTDELPFVPCGLVRWFPYAILTAVSFIGFFIAAGYTAAIFLRPRGHKQGTCTATLLFLALLLLGIIVGWTPPGHLNTLELAYVPPLTAEFEIVIPEDLARRPDRRDYDAAKIEAIHDGQEEISKEGKKAPSPEETEQRLRHEWLNDLNLGDTHLHEHGVHGVTGAFLFDAHNEKYGSIKAAVILAHLTFFLGALLAVLDCILSENKPAQDGEGKRDSVSSEM